MQVQDCTACPQFNDDTRLTLKVCFRGTCAYQLEVNLHFISPHTRSAKILNQVSQSSRHVNVPRMKILYTLPYVPSMLSIARPRLTLDCKRLSCWNMLKYMPRNARVHAPKAQNHPVLQKLSKWSNLNG